MLTYCIKHVGFLMTFSFPFTELMHTCRNQNVNEICSLDQWDYEILHVMNLSVYVNNGTCS